MNKPELMFYHSRIAGSNKFNITCELHDRSWSFPIFKSFCYHDTTPEKTLEMCHKIFDILKEYSSIPFFEEEINDQDK